MKKIPNVCYLGFGFKLSKKKLNNTPDIIKFKPLSFSNFF